jgi:hypothetical protein
MFEGQGVLEDVLATYLDRQPLPERVELAEASAAPSPESADLTPVDVPQDPLGYLSSSDDIDKHNVNNGHTF